MVYILLNHLGKTVYNHMTSMILGIDPGNSGLSSAINYVTLGRVQTLLVSFSSYVNKDDNNYCSLRRNGL